MAADHSNYKWTIEIQDFARRWKFLPDFAEPINIVLGNNNWLYEKRKNKSVDCVEKMQGT
jgi:hypothetical protein